MSLNFDHLLATGGIAAVVVAAWSHLRAIAGYLTSFLIVTAHFDTSQDSDVRRFLKTRWRALPSGLLYYTNVYYPWVKGRPNGGAVPFRQLAPSGVFVRGRAAIFVSFTQQGTIIRGLRGTIDFDDFYSKAHAEAWNLYGKWLEEHPPRPRFSIIEVEGEEKGLSARAGSIQDSDVRPDQGALAKYTPAGLDPDIDRSFLYSRDEYSEGAAGDPFEGLYFNSHVLDHVDDAKRWLKMGEWYRERGIPWRRGWGLFGSPGTGKSSLARALARALDIRLYHFHMSTLSSREFGHAWRCMKGPCVVLFEDFDTVFRGRTNITEHKSLAFDEVLNALSGVSPMMGTFLIITANDPSAIDPAIGVTSGETGISSRPGRIDQIIQLGTISKGNRRRMAASILRDWPEIVEEVVALGDGHTPVQFQETCIQQAFDMLAGEPLGKGFLPSASPTTGKHPLQMTG